jgi:ACS family glucarate transporter-like MFS transporter
MNTNSNPWKMVILLCATATASYICRVNVSTAGPLLMEEFGLSQVAMGRVFSAFLLGYALFQVPAGALADKWGASKILGWAAWLWVALTVIQSLTGWGPFQVNSGYALILFLISRFLLGVSESPTFPGAAKGVSMWVQPGFQGRANGIVIAAVGLGSAIAPPLISNIMVHWGWRVALIVSAIPALVIAILWKKINIQPGEKSYHQKETEVIQTDVPDTSNLKSLSFILLTASYTLQGYVGYIFVSWFYIYLVQERHFSLLSGAWMSSLPWILSIISIPLGGIISDRLAAGKAGRIWGSRIVPITGMAMSGILISIGAHTGNAIIAAISLAFATAFVLCVEGPFWSMMINIAGKKSGKAGGIMNMGSNLGGLISPTLTPLMASFIGWENALHIAAFLSLIAAGLWLGIRPLKNEQTG